MGERIKRPAAVFDPARGLLRNDHFQMAYATNDIERAQALFSERYGIREYRQLKGEMPSGGHIHVELAWVGNTMYELISASGPGSEIYMSRLPDSEFTIRHHHLGFLIYNREDWDQLHRVIAEGGFDLLSENNNQGFMRHCFVDAPELGHYLEYIFPEPAGLAFFEAVPGN